MEEASEIGSVWRHKKTGSVYTIIGACRLEHSNAPAYLYRLAHDPDGITWARDMDEFLDGRFEKITFSPSWERVTA